MRCPKCQFENEPNKKFCTKCGTKLSPKCPNCDSEVEVEDLFCGECGTNLTAPSKPASKELSAADAVPPRKSRRAPDAERRQLTVMFCDLVDSTALSAKLDPEDLREVVRAYQKASSEVIERYEGHIAQYLGDGLLVYFGYPRAHEQDAERAVRSGLEIVEAIGTLNPNLRQDRDIELAVRVGVHTGLVVVGEMGGGRRQEQLALGETPNIAARLQALAEPNTVLMSEATARLVEGYFISEDLGERTLKGIDGPLSVYRVLEPTGVRGRLEVTRPRGLTPLVGRESEVALLLDRWSRVGEGLGQVVLLIGEAGIGKSRLMLVTMEQLAGTPHLNFECRCSPFHQNTAWYPVVDIWERMLGFEGEQAPGEKLKKLETALVPFSLPQEETVPLFAGLLSLPLPEGRYPPLTWSPQLRRQKTMEALLATLLESADNQPVLLVVEDLHWADPSTLELLDLLVDQAPTFPIFALLTCRPEFQPPWAIRAHMTHLTLNRLPRGQTEELATRRAGGKRLPQEVLEQIATETDGVPLFVEELTQAVLESGLLREADGHFELTGPLTELAIPTTLQDALTARLDRLGEAKEVAQFAAVLGRTFSYELLRAAAELDETKLREELTSLVRAELLYQRGMPPRATYSFKHALIQDAAYQSLLRSTRRQYHEKIAQVVEAQFPGTAESQPQILAHHLTEAGQNEQAIRYWQRAGQRANEHSAYQEAVNHFEKGIELLDKLPETSVRDRQEILLQTDLGNALMTIRGRTAPEVEQAFSRVQELCMRVADAAGTFQASWGLCFLHIVRGDLKKALELGEQLLSLAARLRQPTLALEAHHAMWTTLYYLGELACSLEHTEKGLEIFQSKELPPSAFRSVQDPRVLCLCYAALTLGGLGYPDQSRDRMQEALELAKRLDHPYTMAMVLTHAQTYHQARDEVNAVQETAAANLALSTKHGFVQWVAAAEALLGWALSKQGRCEEGIPLVHQGLERWQSIGAGLGRSFALGVLADAYGAAGKANEGLQLLEEAFITMEHNREPILEAQLYCFKGELLADLDVRNQPEAEVCFQLALEAARGRKAKWLELRAIMNLARLWQQQGKQEEARKALVEIYSWFTEGFDSAGLKKAKALLGELKA